MSVAALARAPAPIGWFVHHQGRGHAERCAAILRRMPAARPVTVFCARPDILRGLPAQVAVRPIPSLFERRGDEAALDHLPQPETVHCAPVGWPAITEAMARIAGWWAEARPALMVVDVSAELAQMARLCAVPHVHILQHGRRDDPGHRAAHDGAAGLLAPCAEALAQPDWHRWRERVHYAGGLGLAEPMPDRAEARARLGLTPDEEVILVVSGGGGDGMAAAPLAVGARALPRARWVTIGQVRRDWHATEPANLRHLGWVDDAADRIAAADLVVASTGNTTVQQVLAAGRPFLAVPEWRYFDEQVCKAAALRRAGLAHALPALPASAGAWRRALAATRRGHDRARQHAAVAGDAAAGAARWLDRLARDMSPRTAPEPHLIAGE